MGRAPRPASKARPRGKRGVPPRRLQAAGAQTTGLADRGVFSKYDSKISLQVPPFIGTRGNRIHIDKHARVLALYHRGHPVKAYPVRFGFNPKGDKVKQGDGRTPEGRYYICEALSKNLARRYGARSLRLSYPNVADGERGLRAGLINAAQLARIRRAIRRGRMPPQNTRLGSSIRIHGGGIRGNWTLGCIALRDADVIELYRHVGLGTPVVVRAKGIGTGDADGDGIPDPVDVLLGGKKLVRNAARYHGSYVRLRYPMGDVSPKIGVCTDVIVRALRNAGWDLQQLMHIDIRSRRRAYRWIRRPDKNIDHRRVKNMVVYFKKRFQLLATSVSQATRKTLLPGDVVFMDTLSKAGPDHVGIISDRLGKSGYPLVINNWTVGHRTAEMDLLGSVPVTHHFRLTAPKRAAAGRP